MEGSLIGREGSNRRQRKWCEKVEADLGRISEQAWQRWSEGKVGKRRVESVESRLIVEI
jgi:hypothetical protein